VGICQSHDYHRANPLRSRATSTGTSATYDRPMSASLVAVGLAAGHGARTLFSGLDLAVAPGDVVGVVGANGAGKSTLLRILAGLRAPDEGTVSLRPHDATVGLLPQERTENSVETVWDYLARRTGVGAAKDTMDEAAHALAAGAPGAEHSYAAALERWLQLGGADLEDRIGPVLAETGLAVDLHRPMGSLSGGQSARAALSSLLLSRYDIVLLDEPTNDLDLAGLDVLERFVVGLRAGAVLISHDRAFLERTVTRVVELDYAQQKVRSVDGGYRAYLAERELERRREREAYEAYAERAEELKARARTQRAWMEKGVANARRKATDNDKFIPHFRAESSEKQAAKARQTDRLLQRLQKVEEPRKEWQLRMEIAEAPRSGRVVASADAAVVRRAGFTLGPVTLQIEWADRVAVTGPNGAGKSTLLALLLGRVPPDEGRVTLGPGVRVGQVDQARALLDGAAPLLDAAGDALPDLDRAELRGLLAKFNLRDDHVRRPCASLSPGERTRAALAVLQGRAVNLLVLDEPTNHLDLPAIEQLETALESFDGTILLVTHDRQMLANVRLTRTLLVNAGHVTEIGARSSSDTP
jgi:ATPase subunit of ABC transporter with duplicated ATPase domains